MQRWQKISWIGVVILTLTAFVESPQLEAAIDKNPLAVRDVDSLARGMRYTEEINLNFGLNDFEVFTTITPMIAEREKLVLQRVSTHTLLTDGQSLMSANVSLRDDGGTFAKIWVSQTFQAASTSLNPQRHFTGNQEINVVLNPGDQIFISLFRNGAQGAPSSNFGDVTLIGYFLVDDL